MPFEEGESGNPQKQFKLGQSGNAAGRPVGSKNRSTIARKVLEMRGLLPAEDLLKLQTMFPDISKEMTMEEIITIVQAGKAAAKDTYAYQALMDSAYGKAQQDFTSGGEKIALPITGLIIQQPQTEGDE